MTQDIARRHLSETQLVVDLCGTHPPPVAKDLFAGSNASDVDWNFFFDIVARWKVEQTVYGNLRRRAGSQIPTQVVERASALERNARAIAVGRTLALTDVVSKLESAGISSIVLKGPSVGIAAYGEPSLRAFADTDLLVHSHEILGARQFLVSIGYEPQYDLAVERALLDNGHALELSTTANKVELHADLISRHLRFSIPTEDLWNSAVVVDCTGVPIRVLCKSHLFLFLCAHGAKHEWGELRWILDIAQLLTRIDRNEAKAILLLAGRLHSRRLLAVGLRVARDLLGADISAFPDRELVPEADTQALVAIVRGGIFPGSVGSVRPREDWFSKADARLAPVVFWLRSRERFLDRAGVLLDLALVPTARDEGVKIARSLHRPLRLGASMLRRSLRL